MNTVKESFHAGSDFEAPRVWGRDNEPAPTPPGRSELVYQLLIRDQGTEVNVYH